MRHEDPWQDIGACKWAGCSLAERFAQVFQEVEYGVKAHGIMTRPPWKVASLYIDKSMQGFGPYQTIFGSFKEASQNKNTRLAFAQYLTPDDFKDDKAMMRAIFEKPTMSYAFLLYYLLSQLRYTTFADTAMRATPILPPFFRNKVHARQLGLMGAATIVSAYPERAITTPIVACVGSPTIPFYQFISDLLGGKQLFPNTGRRQIVLTTTNGLKFMTYFDFDPKATGQKQ